LAFTGTPEGVISGYPKDKQVWLKSGDKLVTSIEKLGDLSFSADIELSTLRLNLFAVIAGHSASKTHQVRAPDRERCRRLMLEAVALPLQEAVQEALIASGGIPSGAFGLRGGRALRTAEQVFEGL
jgi:hypothetical protein